MIRYIISFSLLLIAISTLSQDLELNIQNKKLADFLKIEQLLGSERTENTSHFILKNGLAQPIQFRRKQRDLPDLTVQYFYFEKDSVIDNVVYEWSETNFQENKENATISNEEMKAFIDKYKDVYQQIFSKYGKSKSEGSIDDTSKIIKGGFEKTDHWNTSDSSGIIFYIILSKKYEKRGSMTITPTYRIRLEVQNLAENGIKEDALKLTENKIKELDSVFNSFLSELKNNDFEKAKLCLSGLILSTVTNEQLQNLRKSIKSNNRLIVYFTGVQIGLDGSNYVMLQYKYNKDSNVPPKDLIKVIFDRENKIAGIQPIKRQ